MKRTVITVWMLVSLLSTFVAIPLLESKSCALIYGSKFLDANFIIEYIQMWWRKFIRRLTFQYGPAEIVAPNEEQAEAYNLPTTKTKVTEPKNIYELITYLKLNQAQYSEKILSYIEANGLPNKSTQIDLMIVPENIYVTFSWDQNKLTIYDGWIGDQNAQEYIVATATSNLVMTLYENQDDPSTLRSLVLEAEANGDLSYTIKRINPNETVTTYLTFIELVASSLAIIGWTMIILHYRRLS